MYVLTYEYGYMDALLTSMQCQFATVVAVCVGIMTLRWLTEPRLEALALTLGGPKLDPVKAHKFAHQAFNLCYHTAATMYGYELIYRQGRWLDASVDMERRLEAVFNDKAMVTFAPTLFFCCSFGYHLERLLLLLMERGRPDFREMLLHHVTSVFLLTCGVFYLHSYLRLGFLILFVHDASDILGCLIKMVNALGKKVMSLVIFFPMVGVWYYTRMHIFPWQVIALSALAPETPPKPYILGFLWVLVALHTYWFLLFMKMLWLAVRSGMERVEDLQEDVSPNTSKLPSPLGSPKHKSPAKEKL